MRAVNGAANGLRPSIAAETAAHQVSVDHPDRRSDLPSDSSRRRFGTALNTTRPSKRRSSRLDDLEGALDELRRPPSLASSAMYGQVAGTMSIGHHKATPRP